MTSGKCGKCRKQKPMFYWNTTFFFVCYKCLFELNQAKTGTCLQRNSVTDTNESKNHSILSNRRKIIRANKGVDRAT